GPNPIVRGTKASRLLIVSQAPGTRVHETGLSFDDRSGDRLRDWLGIGRDVFYDEDRVAVMGMGFCYPGRDAKGGDLPPRRECAPLWHPRLRPHFAAAGRPCWFAPTRSTAISAASRWARRSRAGASSCPTISSCRIRAGARCSGSAPIPGSRPSCCPSCAPGSPPRLPRLLDPLHVLVAEAEMVADLVDQHVADNRVERLVVLAPVIEDRAAVEEHHVGLDPRVDDAFARQRDPTVKAEQVERAFQLHLGLGFLVGKVLDADHQRPELLSHRRGYRCQRPLGEPLDLLRGRCAPPGHALFSRPLRRRMRWSRNSPERRVTPRSPDCGVGARSPAATRSTRTTNSAISPRPGRCCRASPFSPRKWITIPRSSTSTTGSN